LSELNKGPRPDYKSLKELSRELKRPVGTLLAQASNCDPFYAGMPSRQRRAEWFAAIWEKYQFREGIHQGGVHYILIMQPTKDHEGMLYENTERCWERLLLAGRDARLLELVPLDAFEDRRNAEAIEYLPNFNEPLEISVDSSFRRAATRGSG
jgi:hypothetical protein